MAVMQVILQNPAGTQTDITAKLLADGLPDLALSFEADAGKWSSGDIALSCKNEDAYFTGIWTLPLSPEIVWDEATLKGTWYIQIKKGGVLRWHGDIDPASVAFDTKQKSVSFSVLDAGKRAERHNAALVKRAVDAPLYFTCTVGHRKIAIVESDGTTPRLVSASNLAVGDKIKVTQLTTNGAPVEQELEIKTLGPSVPEGLDAYQVKIKGYPKKAYTSGVVSNPWYRGQTVAYVVGKLLDHMGIGAGVRDIAGVNTTLVVDEADFEGKSVAEAFSELAAYSSSEWWESCGTWYFIGRETSKTGNTPKVIDSLLSEKSTAALYDRYFLTVVARGTKDRYYRLGRVTYNKLELEISTDFTSDLDTLQGIAQAGFTAWGTRRAVCDVVLLDDGTAYQRKDLVTMDGENWWVIEAGEPMRSVGSLTIAGAETPVRDLIPLKLLQVTGTAPSAADLDPHDDNTDYDPPYPPVDLELGKGTDAVGSLPAWWEDGWNGVGTGFRYLFAEADGWRKTRVVGVEKLDDNSFKLIMERLWVVRFKNHPDNPAPDGWELTVYKSGKDPSKPSQPQHAFRDPACDADGYYYIPWYKRISDTATDKECVVQHWDRERGFSCYSDPVATSDAETQTQPGIPTLTLTSAVNDKTGTAKKECDLSVSIAFAGCHAVDIEVVEYDGSIVVSRFDDHIALKDATSPITRKYKRVGEKGNVFYARVRGKQETLYTNWSCLDGASAWNHAPPVGAYSVVAGGASPLVTAPTATPAQGPPTLAVAFDAHASGGTAPYTYDWDYGDGSTHGSTATPSHNYAAGAWAAILTVTDSAGQKVTAPALMIMAGLSGMPVPVLTADTTHGAPTLAVTFTRVATGGTAPYAWSVDYGDGATPASGTGWNGASTALSAHNYTTAGTRTAILSVTDAAGVTAKIELAIFVGVPITPGTFAIGVGAFVSSVVKIPGSTASRCDATCPFTVANAVSAIATCSDGTKTHKATAECSGGSGTFYWGPHFKRGLTLTITSVELINGQSRATVSTPANGTCTAGASAAPTPGVVTVGTVETKKRHNLYPLSFAGDVTLTWCERFKGASGATGDPDSNPTVWKALPPIKLFTRDVNGDPVCNVTTAEADVRHAQDATIDVQFRLENVYGNKGAFVKSSGTAPGDSDDTAPAVPTIGTVTSVSKDLKGTPRKECDLSIPLTFTGTDKIQAQVSDPDGVVSSPPEIVIGKTSATIYWKHKFDRGDTLYYRVRGQRGTAWSAWSTLDASWPASAPSIVAGGATTNPAAPTSFTIEERKKNHTTALVAIPADTTLRKIELWKKLHAAADATTPADSGNTWTFVKRLDIHQLAVSGVTSTPISFQHKQDLDWDLAARFIDCYGGSATLTGANWATVRTGGSAGDGGDPINGSPWTFSANASYNAGGYIDVSGAGGAESARLDIPLHKQRIAAQGQLYTALSGQQVCFLDDNGYNGYYFSFNSTTSGQLYKVNGSGTATSVGAAVTFSPALVAYTIYDFRFEVHLTKVVLIIGPASQRFEWTESTYRTAGWKFWIRNSTASAKVRLYALAVDNNGSYYNGLAVASLQLVTNASNHLDARGADVTDGTNFETLNNFFEYRNSAMHLRGAKLTGPKLTAVASLPALASVEEGSFRSCKVTGGSRRLYFVGSDDSGAKEWWKILVDDANDAGTGSGATVPSGDIDMACFLLGSELPTPDGFALLDDLVIGQELLALDMRTGEEVVTTVTDIKRHTVPYYILLGGFLGATEEHLLFRWGGGRPPCDCTRCTVGGLELGAMLWNRGSAPYALDSKEVISGEVEVASIETGTRTYWIGKDGRYILAHNLKSLDI